MLALVMPLLSATAVFVTVLAGNIFFARNLLFADAERAAVVVGLPILGAAAVTYAVGRAGLRRGWVTRKVLLVGWGVVVAGLLAVVIFLIPALSNVRRMSQAKAVSSNLRELEAAADQYYLETGAIFATYDDLVGPARYIKAIRPVVGEDYRSLGPIRQDHDDELRIKLPDGRVVAQPQVDAVPDGLHVTESGDLHFETTYRHGYPDGPSRVLTKKGEVVCSVNYVEGHIEGPCWYLGKDLSSPASRPPDVLGQEALAARDFKGAEADFTRALATDPSYENYLGRADARVGQGLLDPAVADYGAAMKTIDRSSLSLDAGRVRKLQEAYRQRSARRKAQGDVAGAGADDLAAARLDVPDLFVQGSKLRQAGNNAAAAAIYTRIIQIEPGAAAFEWRSQVRYELGNIDGAIADLNEVVRLETSPPSFDYLKRAYLYRLKNDLPGAAAEFRAVVGARPNDINARGETCHAACWLYLVDCERGQAHAAAEELARTVARVDRLGPRTQVWYRLEADLLLGRLTEDQLLAKVAVPAGQLGDSDRFQALFFAGMLRQRAGDTAAALDRFRRALKTTYAQQFVPDVMEARRAVNGPESAGK